MKKHILCFLVFLPLLSCGIEEIVIAQSETYSIKSSYTKQKYLIKILLPKDYNSTKEYPTVYLTDAFLHFNTVANNIIQLDNVIQDVILIGIFYEDYPFSIKNATNIGRLRAMDFTYPFDQNQANEGIIGGGGLLFYQFLKEELIPIIEQNYSTSVSQRTIAGHSLGGYFSLFQLFNFTEESLFPNVIALSPSIYWADLNILRIEESIDRDIHHLPFKLYLGIGEQEGVQNNVLFNELVKKFSEHNYQNLKYQADRYSGGHIHSTDKGFNKAFKYLFK